MANADVLTVQTLPDARKDGGVSALTDWSYYTTRGELLPSWGTRNRERLLRAYYLHPYNTLVQGAFMGLIKKVKGTPWEIVGGKTRTSYFSKMLREAEFGRGWGDFLSRVLLDYLRHDVGAFVEIIAPGNPKRPPTGRVVGLAHLDSLRCYLTGDPEFPVIYYSQDGKTHLLHHERVLHWVDMPDGNEDFRDYGLSAQSRVIAVTERQIYMKKYIRAKLDDMPMPGFIVGSNLNRSEMSRALNQLQEDLKMDSPPITGRTVILYGTNPQETAELKSLTFNEPPEGFDYEKYMGIDINEIALGLGVDRQELWELSGANIGSATQSEILHAKSQGKAYGDILTMIERDMNRLLPEDLDFTWKVKDPQEQQNTAMNAQTWVNTVMQLKGQINDDLLNRILATQVRAIADAIIDENGDLVRMNDVDPEAPDTQTPTPADDNVQNDVENRAPGIGGQTGASKDIQSTREAFESEFNGILTNARKSVYKEVRLRSILLNLIRKYGEPAYLDGKREGGVDEPLTEAEDAEVLTLLASQRGYVNNFAKSLLETGITDAQAVQKPDLWMASLYPFLNAGRMSANANGMYEWKLGVAEHCATCLTLNGQKHRIKEFTGRGLTPKSMKLDCRLGCKCSLVRTTGRARGHLPNIKELHHDHTGIVGAPLAVSAAPAEQVSEVSHAV